MSVPVDMLVDPLYRRSHVGTLMLLTDDQRAVVSSAPVSAETGRMLKMNAAQMDNDTYRYTLQGAILREPRLSGIALTAFFGTAPATDCLRSSDACAGERGHQPCSRKRHSDRPVHRPAKRLFDSHRQRARRQRLQREPSVISLCR